ncbi:MAG: glycosyltransferase ArnT-like protein [Psychroflexus halocasei]
MKALNFIHQNKKLAGFLSIALMLLVYAELSFNTERYEHLKLFSYYGLAFGFSIILTKLFKKKVWLLFGLAIIIRLFFINHIPALSQDFYRFIWDGMLNWEGYNAYVALPQNFLETHHLENLDFSKFLITKMGDLSAGNHTNYPPLAQWIYTLSYGVSKDSLINNIIFLRVINWLAEIGIIFFLIKILKFLKIKKHYVFYFILNPLIILEITGNLHFEAVMLFFFLGFIYHMLKNSSVRLISIFLSLSILSKLLPLIIFPLILSYQFYRGNNKKNFKKSTQILLLSSLIIGLAYVNFIDKNLISSYQSSLSLWFQKFEFNASLYYIFREIGYQWVDYNAISLIGKLLAISIFSLVIFTSFYQYKNNREVDFLKRIVYIFTIYLLLSTTIHPWYLILPFGVSMLTKQKLFWVWSLSIILSYHAYHQNYFSENLWIVMIEYAFIFLVIILSKRYHYLFQKKIKHLEN